MDCYYTEVVREEGPLKGWVDWAVRSAKQDQVLTLVALDLVDHCPSLRFHTKVKWPQQLGPWTAVERGGFLQVRGEHRGVIELSGESSAQVCITD